MSVINTILTFEIVFGNDFQEEMLACEHEIPVSEIMYDSPIVDLIGNNVNKNFYTIYCMVNHKTNY